MCIVHVQVKCIHLNQTNYCISFYPGTYAIQGIIPRLPYGLNSLGISEQTTIALLCTLMELCIGNPENARYYTCTVYLLELYQLTITIIKTPLLWHN